MEEKDITQPELAEELFPSEQVELEEAAIKLLDEELMEKNFGLPNIMQIIADLERESEFFL